MKYRKEKYIQLSICITLMIRINWQLFISLKNHKAYKKIYSSRNIQVRNINIQGRNMFQINFEAEAVEEVVPEGLERGFKERPTTNACDFANMKKVPVDLQNIPTYLQLSPFFLGGGGHPKVEPNHPNKRQIIKNSFILKQSNSCLSV